MSTLERTLRAEAPRRKYYQRKNETRTTNHWGQRKLLLSEIEFLTDPFHPNLTAAAKRNSRIHLKKEFFTDDMAMEYRDDHVLFISDIRTADPEAMNGEQVEDAIADDNRMQFAWHLTLQPAASMLKFRIGWGKGTTQYLSGYSNEGKIYLPVWGRQSTTETRLVAVGDETYDYDNTKYEEQCFYFNTITRVQYYEHPIDVSRVPGLCHCYDCAAEVHILWQWAKKFPNEWYSPSSEGGTDSHGEKEILQPTEEDIKEQVTNMCLRLNVECAASGNRDLTVQIGHGQKWFTPKLFDAKAGVITHAPTHRRGAEKTTRKERGHEDLSRPHKK